MRRAAKSARGSGARGASSRGAADRALRAQLERLIGWEDAHVGFDTVVKDWPVALRGKRPRGFPHSAWQLVEHLRLAQEDIYDFCVNPDYAHRKWPEEYWPKSPTPPNMAAWTRSLATFRADRATVQKLATNPRIELYARIPHGTGQTILRELLLVADHNAYHVGQLVLLRRALGIWPKG